MKFQKIGRCLVIFQHKSKPHFHSHAKTSIQSNEAAMDAPPCQHFFRIQVENANVLFDNKMLKASGESVVCPQKEAEESGHSAVVTS